MPLEARLLVFGAIHIAEGPKTSLVATSEARKAIVDDALPTVFPGKEKVRFSDHLRPPISILHGDKKTRRLQRDDDRMTQTLFV